MKTHRSLSTKCVFRVEDPDRELWDQFSLELWCVGEGSWQRSGLSACITECNWSSSSSSSSLEDQWASCFSGHFTDQPSQPGLHDITRSSDLWQKRAATVTSVKLRNPSLLVNESLLHPTMPQCVSLNNSCIISLDDRKWLTERNLTPRPDPLSRGHQVSGDH